MRKILLIALIFTSATEAFGQTLHIYGGRNHVYYLGCLNCNEYDKNSIWNEYSIYGNNYSPISIWNEYGPYGNEYSPYSPWNEYSSTPPVIVDKDGRFYGYFTTNEYQSQRADFELALIVCKYYALIRNDVTKWYKKIFD